MQQIADWLEKLGLGQYAQRFAENDTSFVILPELTDQDLEKIGVACPKDGGELVERKTRKGRTFFGCENYPNCDFTSWKRPLKQPCPKCGGLLVIANKREAQCTNCQESFLLEEVVPETVE